MPALGLINRRPGKSKTHLRKENAFSEVGIPNGSDNGKI
jgi:hypothetical protein